MKKFLVNDANIMRLDYVAQNPEILKISSSLPNHRKRILPAMDLTIQRQTRDLEKIDEQDVPSSADINDSLPSSSKMRISRPNVLPSLSNFPGGSQNLSNMQQPMTQEERMESRNLEEDNEGQEKITSLPRLGANTELRLQSAAVTVKGRGLTSATTKAESLGIKKLGPKVQHTIPI